MGRKDYHFKHEPCLYGWKPGAAHYFVKDRTNSTIIEDRLDYRKLPKAELIKLLDQIFQDETKTTVIHQDKPQRSELRPTMKPVTLMGELITNSSRPGQIVLDPFAGSGSTLIAGHQLKRPVYLADSEPRYCAVILDRIQKLDPGITIQQLGAEHEF